MLVVGGGGGAAANGGAAAAATTENEELELEQHMIEGPAPASIPLLKILLGSCNWVDENENNSVKKA